MHSLVTSSAPTGFRRGRYDKPTVNCLSQGLAHMQNKYKPCWMSVTRQPIAPPLLPQKVGEGRDMAE